MPQAAMAEGRSRPHLFGLAKIVDADTLRQAIAGWWPGVDEMLPERSLAGVDAFGDGFSIHPSRARDLSLLEQLEYPVHVINCVVLPSSMVKPAADARPYQR